MNNKLMMINGCTHCHTMPTNVKVATYVEHGFKKICPGCGAELKQYNSPKYPFIHVDISKYDGDSFAIIFRVRSALLHDNVPELQRKLFTEEVMADGDYYDMISICMQWVNIEKEG